MPNEEIKSLISNILPSAAFDESGEWLNVTVEPHTFRPFMEQMRLAPGFNFDYLFCLTCVDYPTYMTMVYHLTSTTSKNTLVVKVKLERSKPSIETVCDIWRTAEFHEREVFDLFGVHFSNHPDLRRLMLTDDWVGHPLRKDYDDPINMIKL
jgi:NADH-quinone oxidoreductase subunit C